LEVQAGLSYFLESRTAKPINNDRSRGNPEGRT